MHEPLNVPFGAKHRLHHALELEQAGFALIPVAPRSKAPYSDLLEALHRSRSWTPLGERRATASEIQAWFEYEPDINIGIITGQSSGGLVVVDVDTPHKAKDIPRPPTVVVNTRGINSGRGHYYYRSRSEVPTKTFEWGEVKGEGGYVVAAHSVHPTGGLYGYGEMLTPEEYPWPQLTERPKYDTEGAEETTAPTPLTPSKPLRSKEPNIPSSPLLRGRVAQHTRTRFMEEYLALAAVHEVAEKVLSLCGVETEVGKSFRCPLPGHEEANPSAALWEKPDGVIMMQDFHARTRKYVEMDGEKVADTKHPLTDDEGYIVWWPLPDVFAAVTTSQTELLGVGERALWWLRALHQAGCIPLTAQMGAQLPPDAPRAAKRLYEGFLYLLELRRLYDPNQGNAAPYTWRFAAKWCGYKGMNTVSRGMKWLLGRGYLRVQQEGSKMGDTGKRHPTTFILGTPKGE